MSQVTYAGYLNGFPFPLKPWDSVPDVPAPGADAGNVNKTMFPLSVSRALASRWYWRVKSWKVTYSVLDQYAPWGGVEIYSWESDTRVRCEPGLVSFPLGLTYTRATASRYGNVTAMYPLSFKILPYGFLDADPGNILNPPRGVKEGTDGNTRLGITFITQASSAAEQLRTYADNTNQALQTKTTCVIQDAGQSYQMPLYNVLGNYEMVDNIGAQSAEFIISPHEFWAYQDSTGRALYDTQNGNIIPDDALYPDFSDPRNGGYHPII